MSDFLDDLGEELDAAARRRARRRPAFAFGWSRRTLAVAVAAAVAIVSVPAAAVTGVFSGSSEPLPRDLTQPGVVDLGGPPCVIKDGRKLRTTTAQPPPELTALLAVLRRPQQASDRLSPKALDRLAALPVDGVNPDTIRLATSLDGRRIYLVPAQNIRYFPPLPDTEGCKRMQAPSPKPAAGVCLVERGSDGGATCSGVEAIGRGLSMLTHGRTLVAGIAHDGVRAVIWRVHRGRGFLDTRIPIRNNVYAATVPGRAGRGLYVFFETARGRQLVRGPRRFTKSELAQLRLDKRLDATAGRKPTVSRATAGATTIFVLRMRVAPVSKVYVVRWRGPAGTPCAGGASTSRGLLPATRGPQAGLLRTAFGPPVATQRWCPGSYTGTIRTQLHGRRDVNGPIVARFSFRVR
jgi:hypothetical protein